MSGRIAWLTSAGVIVVDIVLVVRSLSWSPVADSPPVRFVARGILDGALPYRDFFDTNLPGTHLIYVLGLAALGASDPAFRILDLTILAGVLGGFIAILLRFGVLPATLSAGLVVSFHLAGGPDHAMERDFLLCLPLAWAVVASLSYARVPRRGRLAVAAIGLGAAAWIKPHSALLLPGLVALVWREEHRGRRLGSLALLLAVYALPGVVILLWLQAGGALGAFWDIVQGYLVPVYSRLDRATTTELLFFYPRRYLGIRLYLASALLILVLLRRWGWTATVLALGVGYGWLHFFIQGKATHYQAYPVVVFSIALGGAALGAALDAGRQTLVLVHTLLAAATAATFVLVGLAPMPAVDKELRITRELVGLLGPIVRQGRTVQVFDTSAGGIRALELLGARQPTRFIYDFPIFQQVSEPYVRRLREEVVRDLLRRPPGAVVLFEYAWPSGDYSRFDAFPELTVWLAGHCRATREYEGYRVCFVTDPR